MADIYDVEVVLTNLAQTAVYPNGLSQPSVANCDIRLYPGWPIPGSLDADLTAQKANVSIFPSNITRVNTRFEPCWYTTAQNSPTLILKVTGTNVTIAGTVSVIQTCMIIVNGIAYTYTVKLSDTLNSIASQLANLIPNATSVGAIILIGGGARIVQTRVIVTGTSTRELAREKRMVLVSVWASNPLMRSQIASAITTLFAATYRVALPDGFYGQLSYSGFKEDDSLERVKCYYRHLHFLFEFATTQAITTYTIGENIIITNQQEPINPEIDLGLCSGESLELLNSNNFELFDKNTY